MPHKKKKKIALSDIGNFSSAADEAVHFKFDRQIDF